MRTIQTTNSQIDGVVIAPLWRRLCAWLLDSMLIGGAQIALFVVYIILYAVVDWGATGDFRTNYSTEELNISPVIGWLWFFAPYFLYHTILLRFWSGHTPGKNFMTVQVVAKNGIAPTLWQAFARSLLMPVSAIPLLLGYFAYARSRRNTSFHDWIASTFVLQEVVEHRILRGTVPPHPVTAHH